MKWTKKGGGPPAGKGVGRSAVSSPSGVWGRAPVYNLGVWGAL